MPGCLTPTRLPVKKLIRLLSIIDSKHPKAEAMILGGHISLEDENGRIGSISFKNGSIYFAAEEIRK